MIVTLALAVQTNEIEGKRIEQDFMCGFFDPCVQILSRLSAAPGPRPFDIPNDCQDLQEKGGNCFFAPVRSTCSSESLPTSSPTLAVTRRPAFILLFARQVLVPRWTATTTPVPVGPAPAARPGPAPHTESTDARPTDIYAASIPAASCPLPPPTAGSRPRQPRCPSCPTACDSPNPPQWRLAEASPRTDRGSTRPRVGAT